MAAKKSGLGRGLDALFPEKTKTAPQKSAPIKKEKPIAQKNQEETTESHKGEKVVKISKVEPNRDQPRKKFDEDAGERRWRAAKMAGLKEIPVLVKEFTDQEMVEISLIENIQREDLNPVEEAEAYKRLIDEFHLKQDEIAERVSKSRTAITNVLRLLKLDNRVQQMMVDEMISAGHARAILGIADYEKQYSVAMKVFDEKLSVRETEKLVKVITNPPKKREVSTDSAEEAIYESLEEKMKNITGTRVFIHRKKNNKGKIEIEYYSRDDLDRIIELFESIG